MKKVRYSVEKVDALLSAIEDFINTDLPDGAEWDSRAKNMQYWAATAAGHIEELQEGTTP